MLLHTFSHIPGIGYATERMLWDKGVTTWNQLQQRPEIVPRVSNGEILKYLARSQKFLGHDPHFFINLLKRADTWRLFPHFRASTAYLDIETTGLGGGAEITTISLYDGSEVRTYISGRNLENFLDDVMEFKVLVTYNGISFDIPFIERFFKTKLNHAHIDLRHVLARLGCKGGLKGCEKQMGINRGTLDGIDGAFAVLLWREYERYDNELALETLLAYNIEDTVNLERLLVEAYNRSVANTPFAETLYIPFPDSPQLIFQPDTTIVSLIKQHYY